VSAKSVAPPLQLLLVLLTAWAFNGCGSSSSQPTPPPPPPQSTITLSVSSTSTSVSAGQTTTLTAATNDPKGVTWTLAPATGAGSLSDQTATTVKYTAPATISGAFTATVTATSVSDPAKSESMKISVKGPALSPLSIATNLPAAVYSEAYQGGVTAGGGVPPYTITITGTLPTGLTYSNGVISGTPYYPNNGGAVSFTATDSAIPPNTAQTGNLSISFRYPTSLSILTGSEPNTEIGFGYNEQVVVYSGLPPYTFSVSAGALPPGLSLNNSPGIVGTPTTAGTYNFTFQVSDDEVPPRVATANYSITVYSAVSVSTTSLPGGTVDFPYVAPPVQASGGLPPYIFTAGLLSDGLFINQSGQIGGIPQTSGTISIPVTVEDSLEGTATTTLTVNVTGSSNGSCSNNGNFNGNYAFMLSGGDPQYSNALNFGQAVGSFVADGKGNISQGFIDSAYAFGEISSSQGVTGTYCVGSDNIGTLSFTNALLPFLIAVDSSGNANMIMDLSGSMFASSAAPSFGPIVHQDTTAFSASSIVGNYAFLLSGIGFEPDPSGGGVVQPDGPETQAGTFLSDGAGNLSGELDTEVCCGNAGHVTFSANDFAVSSSQDGRGMVTLNSSSGGLDTFIFYVVNAHELFALAYSVAPNDGSEQAFILTGPIVQGAAGPYTNSSLSGVSVFGWQSDPGVAETGLITWSGSGGFSLTGDENNNGTLNSPSYSGTYSIASDGRVTLNPSGQSTTPIIYLTGQNQGFVINVDADGSVGQILPQSGSPFSAASFSGNYLGAMLPEYISYQCCTNPDVNLELDDFFPDGSGNLTGASYFEDFSQLVAAPFGNPVSGTYSTSLNGRGTVTQSGSTTNIFYVVSPSQVLMISAAGSYPKVMSLSHQ